MRERELIPRSRREGHWVRCTLGLWMLLPVLTIGCDGEASSQGAAVSLENAECVDVDALPVQEVGNGERIIHIGEGPGWAGAHVLLCSQSEPVYRTRFRIRDSRTSVDCNGVVFDGRARDGFGPVSWALSVDASVRPGIHDVEIRDCEFRNYNKGLLLTGPTIENAEPEARLERFRVMGVTVRDLADVGVVVGPHSLDFLLEDLTVERVRLSGVYLEAYSQRTTVRNSTFKANGWSSSQEGREAIAIDASSHNRIVGNVFDNNKFAAITLYKNCGEGADPGMLVPRNMPASYNLIEGNRFYRHDNVDHGAAIIVASRQGLDPDTPGDAFSGECLDEPAPGTNRHWDHSRHNLIRHNAFINNVTSIKIRDSYNHVEQNTFMGVEWTDSDTGRLKHAVYDVAISADFLEEQGSPATGITITGNVTRTSTSNSSGRTFVPLYGANVRFAENVDLSYGCLSQTLVPGNTCAGGRPLNRCEVSATACPARRSWGSFPEFPERWLDNAYGSNLFPEVCAERAREIWEWCDSGSGGFAVETRGFRDGFLRARGSYEGP